MKTRNNLYLTALFASVIAAGAGMTVHAETVAESVTEAAEETVAEAAEEAVEESTEEAYLSDEPLALLIQNASEYIELCDLSELTLTSYYSTITEDDVEMEIDNVLYEYMDYEDVEDGAESGDLITFNMTSTVDEETTIDDDMVYELGYPEFGDDFDEKLEGANVGDVIEFEVTYEEDDYVYEEWVGKTVSFSLEITEVSRPVLPELTEEFVQETLGYASIEEYKEALQEELQENLDLQNEMTNLSLAIDTAAEASTILSYPENMVEEALDEIYEQYGSLAALFGMETDDMLEAYGIDEESLQEQAEADVARRLVISAVIQQEELPFTQAELDESAESLYIYYEYESAEDLAADMGDWMVYAAGEQIVGQYLLDTGLVSEEEDVSYIDDEFDEEIYTADGEADDWFEDEEDEDWDEEDDDEYWDEEDTEDEDFEYWDEEELSEELDDAYWEIEFDTEEE